MIREARYEDLDALLQLYLDLHETQIPANSLELRETWNDILQDKNHHLILNEVDGRLASSCVCVVIPNLTRGVRPYAVIENVVTRKGFRGKGYATECLAYAQEIAEERHCYKMMLLTGSKDPDTLKFYEHAGYNRTDKTAFIRWLN